MHILLTVLRASTSVSCKFVYILLVPGDPLRHERADLKIAKETFVRIHDMVVAYSLPFLPARSSASLRVCEFCESVSCGSEY